jgi:hypothetical protein
MWRYTASHLGINVKEDLLSTMHPENGSNRFGRKSNKFSEELITTFLWYDTGSIENDASNNFSFVARVFVTAVTFLLSRFLASKGVIHITETLPSNDREVHIQTHRLIGGVYEVLRSNALSCYDTHTKFHKEWFRHSKVKKGGEGGITDSMEIA